MADVFDKLAPAVSQGDVFDRVSGGAPVSHGASGSWDAAVPPPPSLPQRILAGAEKIGGMGGPLNPIGQTLGIAKGITSTGANLYQLAGRLVGDPVAPETTRAIDQVTTPRSGAESVGKFTEQAGEFMAGEGALAKGLTKIPALAKAAIVAPRVARAAVAAVSGAGVAKAQGATNEQAAMTGAAGAVLPALIEGTAAGAKWLGQKMQASGLGIGAKQAAAGARVENLNKYGLAKMTIGRTLDAVHSEIVDLATQLRDLVRGANAGVVDQAPAVIAPLDSTASTTAHGSLPGAGISGGAGVAETAAQRMTAAAAHRQAVVDAIKNGQGIPADVAAQYPDLHNAITLSKIAGPKVDLTAAVDQAEQALTSHEGLLRLSPAEAQQVKGALAQYRALYSNLPRGPIVPLDEAQTVKRAAGLAGAWEHGKTAADKGMERVSNLVYGFLKQQIETGVGGAAPELRAINGKLGELMPLEQALVRRIPVEARQQPLSLTDWMLVATGHPIEAGARVLGKSFAGATGMVKAASGMRTASRPLTASVQSILATQQQEPDGELARILGKGGANEAPETAAPPLPGQPIKRDFAGHAIGPAPDDPQMRGTRAYFGPGGNF